MGKIRKRRSLARRTSRGKVWQVQDAKARFSELLNKIEHGDGYQTITKNGREVAVVISKSEFDNLRKPKNTLIEFFENAPFPDEDLDLDRNKDLGRDIDL
jgi:prevent-host-death family protein